MTKIRLALSVVLAVAALAASARADEAAAKKYLDDASALVDKGSQFFEDAGGKLDLAEASLDDVAEPAKAQLKARAAGLRSKIAAAAGAEQKGIIERKVKALLEECEGVVGNLVAWPGKSAELTELLNDPKTAAALGQPAVDGYRKQFATLAKVHGGKALKENLANATTQVEQLEKFWQEKKAAMATVDDAQQRTQSIFPVKRELDAMPRYLKDLPADNADVAALNARVTKVQAEYDAAAGDSEAGIVLDRIKGFFESNADEFNGMDAETATPTWADFKASANNARDLGAPKTLSYYTRTVPWAVELERSEGFRASKDNPALKAEVAEIAAKLQAAKAKLTKNAEALVAGYEAEKATRDNAGDSGMLASRIKYALGDADGKPLADRVAAVEKAGAAAANKAESDKDAYYKTLTEQADKAWPAMLGKYTVAEGFDPNNASALKGQFVKITGNNLMGWRFKHGDFPYATKIGGVPVAGNYSPDVKNAVKEVEAKLGRAIGDNDNDGEWTAVARVEGNTGRLVELVKRSGNVTGGGETVAVEATDEVPVQAPVVTIVALKAGPVAVAQDQGAVKADGTVAAPSAVAAGSAAGVAPAGRGFSFFNLLCGLLAVVVGVACLIKSKFAPLAGNAQAVQLTERVGGQNLAYLGLAGVALGVVGALMSLIALPSGAFLYALIGLVANLAMVVAGVVVSRDLLESHGVLPAKVAVPMAAYAIPSGLACVALGALTLVTSVF